MQYQAPANDLRFLLFDVLGADRLPRLSSPPTRPATARAAPTILKPTL